MATTYTLNPDAVKTNEGWVPTGTTNIVTAVSDSSDSTYIRKPDESTGRGIRFTLSNPTLAAGDIVWRARGIIRSYAGAQNSTGFWLATSLNDSQPPLLWAVGILGSGTTFVDNPTFYLYPRAFSTTATEQALVNSLEFSMRDWSPSGGSPINRMTVAKIRLEVDTTVLPTTTVIGIDGDTASPFTVTTTTNPVIDWSYLQADGIAQQAYEVRVFTAAKADPTVSTDLVWGSGAQIATGVTSAQIPVNLLNGGTYYAYVRNAMRIGNSDYWSLWGSGTAASELQFTVSINPPPTPTVTASWDVTQQRTIVNVQGAVYGTGTQTFLVERQDDVGGPWRAVRDGDALVPDGSYAATVSDYEAPRGARNTYRVSKYRAIAVGISAGLRVTSDPSTEVAVTVVTDGEHWIKDLSDPSRNRGAVRVLADVNFQAEETVDVLRPLGRTDAVVVSGALGGDDGSITILAVGDAEWAAIRTLLVAQRSVLWQDPFGEQRYIRPIRRSWTKAGSTESPRWELDISYVEVPAP